MNKPHISQGRRKLVTGLLGATALTTLAPQQWSQPVINRIVTPAHGQAVSIAAGRYQGEFLISSRDNADCSIFLIFEFHWEGGIQSKVEVLFLRTEQRGADCNDQGDEVNQSLINEIFVRPSGSPPTGNDIFEVINTTPSLPSGFSFFMQFEPN